MMKGSLRRIVGNAGVVATMLLVGVTAGAQDFGYEVNAGIGHSDNITRQETNEQSEGIATVGAQLSLNKRTSRLEADVRGNVAYYNYLDNTFDNEVLGNLVADGQFAIVADRFVWSVSDYFGQVLQDPFLPSTPDNRENINRFATGPDVFIGLGSQTRLRLGGRYAITTYEDSPLDSDTVSGSLGLLHNLSGATVVSLNFQTQKTEYDDDVLNSDYDQSEAFLRYETEGLRTTIGVDLGYTEVDGGGLSETESGPLARIELARRISAASVVTLNAGREFANSGSAFAASQSLGAVDLSTGPGQQTAEPFVNSYATLGWDYSRNRTGLALIVSYGDQDYEAATRSDQTSFGGSATVSRQMTPRTQLSLGAIYTSVSFDQPGGDYNELGGNVSFGWRFTQHLSANVRYDYSVRSGDAANTDYRENRVWLTLAYGGGEVRRTPFLPDFTVDRNPGPTPAP